MKTYSGWIQLGLLILACVIFLGSMVKSTTRFSGFGVEYSAEKTQEVKRQHGKIAKMESPLPGVLRPLSSWLVLGIYFAIAEPHAKMVGNPHFLSTNFPAKFSASFLFVLLLGYIFLTLMDIKPAWVGGLALIGWTGFFLSWPAEQITLVTIVECAYWVALVNFIRAASPNSFSTKKMNILIFLFAFAGSFVSEFSGLGVASAIGFMVIFSRFLNLKGLTVLHPAMAFLGSILGLCLTWSVSKNNLDGALSFQQFFWARHLEIQGFNSLMMLGRYVFSLLGVSIGIGGLILIVRFLLGRIRRSGMGNVFSGTRFFEILPFVAGSLIVFILRFTFDEFRQTWLSAGFLLSFFSLWMTVQAFGTKGNDQ